MAAKVLKQRKKMSQIEKHNNFNIFRLMLASMVLIAHASQLADGNLQRELLRLIFGTLDFGHVAVDLFFILSGYLIVRSWQASPNAMQFLGKRIRRIYPGFIVASLVCAFIVGPLAVKNSAEYFHALDLIDFVNGMVFLQRPSIPEVFRHLGPQQVNVSMWTIFPEFCCYLLVMVMGLLKLMANRRYWLALTVVFVGGFAFERLANIALPLPLLVPVYAIRLGACFMIGGCFFLYRECIHLNGKNALFAATLLFASMFSWRLSEIALVTAGSYLLFYLVFKPIPSIKNFNKLPDVSYGVYLYGFPIQALILWYWPATTSWELLPISMIASLLAGLLSWYCIERRFMRKAEVPHVDMTLGAPIDGNFLADEFMSNGLQDVLGSVTLDEHTNAKFRVQNTSIVLASHRPHR